MPVTHSTSFVGSQDAATLDAEDAAVLDSQDAAVLDSQDTAVLNSQVVAVPDSQPAVLVASQSLVISTHSQKRRASSQRNSPAKYQTVMQERDANADAVLIFTPKTRAGRVRKATLRGKENF
jgi:uncharacterized protein (DUF1800 family)